MQIPRNTVQIVPLQGEPSKIYEWFMVENTMGNMRNQEVALIVHTDAIKRARINKLCYEEHAIKRPLG